MLHFIRIVAFVLVTSNLIAQDIQGFVRDQKQKSALVGATIQASSPSTKTSSGRVAITDDNGFFQFDKIPAGTYSLTVKYLGYESVVKDVVVSENVSIDFELTESFMLTDEIVISATRANDKSPTTFLNVTKLAIQKQNYGQDLPFVLNWTPSLVTTSDAGNGVGYTGMRIRGSDATRINVTINGIPYNDSESQGTYWVDLPDIISSTQSIQVQRGVGTSTNGGSAFGASMNLQTNTKNETPYADIINSAGSFGTHRHTLAMGTGLLNNHFIVDGRISKIGSDGFIDRASSDLSSYYLSAAFYSGNTIVRALSFGGHERTYQSWYGVPESRLQNNRDAMLTTASNEGWNQEQTDNLLNSGSRTFNSYLYPNQVDDYTQHHYQLHVSQRLSSKFTGTSSFHYTKGKGYYEEYRYNDKFSNYGLNPVVIGDSTIAKSDMIRRRWLDNDFYGSTFSLNYDTDATNVVFGGAWNRYIGDHYGELIWAQVTSVPNDFRYYKSRGDKHDFNIYLKANQQLGSRLNAFADLQYRGVSYKSNGIESKQNTAVVYADFNFFNPKFGLTYSPSAHEQVYASFGIGNREPVRDDFVDNPGKSPKHETLQNLEVGYRLTKNRFILHANYYLMNYRNQLVLTGAINDAGASIRTNVDASYRTGLELDGTVKLSPRVKWNANLTLSRNKISRFTEVLYDYGVNFDEYNEVKNDYRNKDISFSPNIIAGSVLSYTIIRNAEISILSKYVGKQFLDNTSNNARTINAYFVNDLRMSYSLKPAFMKELVISLLVNNVLNHTYQSNGYTYGYLGGGQSFRENYFYPQAGTNFLAMLTLKF